MSSKISSRRITKALQFKRTYDSLNSQGKVTTARDLLSYFQSVVTKLNSSEYHANKLLAIKSIVYPSPMVSWGTGSTISTTSGTITTISSPSVTDDDIHRELDGFFFNLFSLLESFAQVINLVYIVPPLADKKATFNKISNIMTTRFRFPIERLTPYLTTLQTGIWFTDMKKFRKCTTHSRSINFYFSCGRESTSASWEPKIILPDNPRSSNPTYIQNREFRTFGINILAEMFRATENMFGLLETRIRSAKRIPVY